MVSGLVPHHRHPTVTRARPEPVYPSSLHSPHTPPPPEVDASRYFPIRTLVRSRIDALAGEQESRGADEHLGRSGQRESKRAGPNQQEMTVLDARHLCGVGAIAGVADWGRIRESTLHKALHGCASVGSACLALVLVGVRWVGCGITEMQRERGGSAVRYWTGSRTRPTSSLPPERPRRTVQVAQSESCSPSWMVQSHSPSWAFSRAYIQSQPSVKLQGLAAGVFTQKLDANTASSLRSERVRHGLS
ncbi:hypothetical protein B0H10DRAFT_2309944 [Mycena sp. CBHHK59/15]|nr:hypothetical protein B0H10DRAFT_2309944 [Mycena sp. CBHHK59/15]